MVNFKSYGYQMILFFVVVLFSIEKSSAQFVLVSCYECTNCTDPFDSRIANITPSCNTCYKLAIDVSYAPYRYVVRKCVPACLEASQAFGGGLLTSSCCATELCNTSSMVKFSKTSSFLLFVFLIFNFIKQLFY